MRRCQIDVGSFTTLQINVWPGHPQSNETVLIRIRTILIPSNGGKKLPRENHQALTVKGKRHPTHGTESNPDCSSEDLNLGLSSRQTCFRDITKPLADEMCMTKFYVSLKWLPKFENQTNMHVTVS